MTESLTERILRHEGIRLFPYNDSLGFKTVAVGHRVTAQDGDKFDKGITHAEAMALLEDDILTAKMAVAKALPWTYSLDDARKDVMVEMAFQLGIVGLRKFTRFLNAVQRQDWDDAVDEMLNSTWHKQAPGRCEELANRMLTGGS